MMSVLLQQTANVTFNKEKINIRLILTTMLICLLVIKNLLKFMKK